MFIDLFTLFPAMFDGYLQERILLFPTGRLINQAIACEPAAYERIALIRGRCGGVDERVREHLATDEISIGDCVLTDGKLPATIS